jgi:hypothetical protein
MSEIMKKKRFEKEDTMSNDILSKIAKKSYFQNLIKNYKWQITLSKKILEPGTNPIKIDNVNAKI